jgi:SPP1 gp7 family putative phage head morphogenesis protein
MLDHAFTRLSENGRLRLENVRDDVHGILLGAQDAGISPIETARQLSKQFDHYRRAQFETLARTETAYASEEGNRIQMRDLGVFAVKWLISADACPICQAFEGQVFSIEDVAKHPPGASHPNCVCSLGPVEAEDLR